MSQVYEQFMQIQAKRKQDMIRPIVAKVKELKALDYDLEMAARVLYPDHPAALIEAAITAVYMNPTGSQSPPRCYEDVKHIVQGTLLAAMENPRSIVAALTAKTPYGSIMPEAVAEHVSLEHFIAHVQIQRNEALLEELHATLKPYVENAIINLTAEADYTTMIVRACTDRDRQVMDRWLEWFGIWPPMMQKAYRKTASMESDSIIYAETYEDGEYTYCPMHKTEINIDHVCRTAACPFYAEIKTAGTGECVRVCKFRK